MVDEATLGPPIARAWLYHLGWMPLVAVAFAAWLLWPASVSESREGRVERTPKVATRVVVAPTQLGSLALEAEATGTLEPWRALQVASEIAGRLVERRVEEGQAVRAGDLLLILDDRDRRIELAEAEAELLRVQANYAVFVSQTADDDLGPGLAAGELEALDHDLDQARSLFAQGLIAERDLRAAERRHQVGLLLDGSRRDDVRAATTGLIQAEQRVERARLALERTRITAAFDGRVADLIVEEGQQVATGEPCLVLLDEQRMTVEVDVLETDLVRLLVGAGATVRLPALDDRRLAGRVHSINPRIDPDTGTGRVRVMIDNPRSTLISGLFAYVELETGRLTDRLLVPNEAVLVRQGRSMVFRVVDQQAFWTWVETGPRTGERTVITDGLATGDLVAVGGHFALSHEAPVDVVSAAELAPGSEG